MAPLWHHCDAKSRPSWRRAIAGKPFQREDRAARTETGDAVDRAVAELEAALNRLAAVSLGLRT
jgi:hypothetical protein